MRILPVVTPTPEQLPILLANNPGVLVIRGAAGSGKTTTALMRLQHLSGVWASRRQRLGLTDPVRILVLTFNRTLEGYIRELANEQIETTADVTLEVMTFGRFALSLLPAGAGPDDAAATVLDGLAASYGLPMTFMRDEVDYILGRFEPDNLEAYITCVREGRGSSPRMNAAARRRLLDEVVYPYLAEKDVRGLRDWNDIAIEAGEAPNAGWDVVIVDEAQDFSANQVRTILQHVADTHSLTFVMDAAQRIYPRSFTWREVGITDVDSRLLKRNYRNTGEIAAFARSLIDGMQIGDDGALPDFTATTSTGQKPKILVGKFSGQVDWAIRTIVQRANLADESVVFLHPLGGGWFSFLRAQLDGNGVPWVQLTRASTWPAGDETVALCTIHSAKGLEFDHVVILGLNQQVTPHGDDDGDARLETLRRLVAMGIGRARVSVTLGMKPGSESSLISLLDPTTYTVVNV